MFESKAKKMIQPCLVGQVLMKKLIYISFFFTAWLLCIHVKMKRQFLLLCICLIFLSAESKSRAVILKLEYFFNDKYMNTFDVELYKVKKEYFSVFHEKKEAMDSMKSISIVHRNNNLFFFYQEEEDSNFCYVFRCSHSKFFIKKTYLYCILTNNKFSYEQCRFSYLSDSFTFYASRIYCYTKEKLIYSFPNTIYYNHLKRKHEKIVKYLYLTTYHNYFLIENNHCEWFPYWHKTNVLKE